MLDYGNMIFQLLSLILIFIFFSGTWDNEQAQKDIEFFLNQFVHTKSTNYLEKFFGRQGRNLADELGNIKNVARVLSGWLLYC